MFRRSLDILKSNSFFLFGARGTGKTSLLESVFPREQYTWLDLLENNIEILLSKDPDALSDFVKKSKEDWIIIDEVQKIPKLLDIVHKEIEKSKIKFALTGSSARKLKRGGANLLAGRAFVYNLFPLSHFEIDKEFILDEVLKWGSLPGIFKCKSETEKRKFLDSYVNTYLTEEIFAEQLVRNITPFKQFLRLAAQSNGAILNFKKIGEDLSIDGKTVKTYFEILQDTLIGFYLPVTSKSFRKQQLTSPKFYLFDTGVTRAIEGVSHFQIDSSQEYGRLFEHWYIAEFFKLNSYKDSPFEMSYLMTKGGVEVDLVLSAPRQKEVFVEIKSTRNVQDFHLKNLKSLKKDYPDNRYICISRDSVSRTRDGIDILNWRESFQELGL